MYYFYMENVSPCNGYNKIFLGFSGKFPQILPAPPHPHVISHFFQSAKKTLQRGYWQVEEKNVIWGKNSVRFVSKNTFSSFFLTHSSKLCNITFHQTPPHRCDDIIFEQSLSSFQKNCCIRNVCPLKMFRAGMNITFKLVVIKISAF